MSKYLYLLSLIFILIVSCSDSTKIVNPPPPLVYQFSDYIHFETTKPYLVAQLQDSSSNTSYPEPFLYWEAVIGEPFTDVNGNGVYDRGIDIFIKSVGSDNMDLNHDGLYNGPLSVWSPGIPFDDVNGDGIFLPPMYMNPDLFTTNKPYYDFNKNGKWDRKPLYNYNVLECTSSKTSNFAASYSFATVDSILNFVSDSNITYWINKRDFTSQLDLSLSFEVTDSNQLSINMPTNLNLQNLPYLLDTEEITSDSIVYVLNDGNGGSIQILKEIILDEQLEYNENLYSDLLLIRLTKILKSNIVPDGYYISLFKFYFSKEFGLIAVIDYSEMIPYGIKNYYFIEKVDSIPLTLSK